MSNVLLLWQVGLIANVKLHVFSVSAIIIHAKCQGRQTFIRVYAIYDTNSCNLNSQPCAKWSHCSMSNNCVHVSFFIRCYLPDVIVFSTKAIPKKLSVYRHHTLLFFLHFTKNKQGFCFQSLALIQVCYEFEPFIVFSMCLFCFRAPSYLLPEKLTVNRKFLA